MDDPTFVWRAPIGTVVLIALALRDRARTGTWSRARELGVLFGAALGAMAYALAHDAVTWSISREYFSVGKGLPEAATSFAPVARLALLAGWSAGLAVGLALVIANNPGRLSRLPERALAPELGRVVAYALLGAGTCAALGAASEPCLGVAIADAGVLSPRSYLVAQGAHAGSYLGAALGAAVSVARVRRARRWLSERRPSPSPGPSAVA